MDDKHRVYVRPGEDESNSRRNIEEDYGGDHGSSGRSGFVHIDHVPQRNNNYSSVNAVQQGVKYHGIQLSIEFVKYQSFIGIGNIWRNIGLGSHQGRHASRYMVFNVTAITYDLHREGHQQAARYRDFRGSGVRYCGDISDAQLKLA